MKKIIITETQLKKVVDKVLNEQSDLTNYNFNKAVQSFLIKKKITDSNNQPVKKDGSIGTLAKNSKSAQAIAKYQSIIGVEPDGVFGYDTMEKMKTKFPNDYKLWLQCKSEEGDLFDKGAHFLGLDEQSAMINQALRQTNVTRPTTQGTTNTSGNNWTNSIQSLNGKTVNLYSDTQNGKFYSQVKINKVQKTNDGKIVLYLTNKGDMSITCTNPKKNEFRYLEPVSRKFVLVYNTPLATKLRKLMCTVNASGTPVPKADFASNTQKPTSDFA
jgi:hypothetical protein